MTVGELRELMKSLPDCAAVHVAVQTGPADDPGPATVGHVHTARGEPGWLGRGRLLLVGRVHE